MQNLAQAAINDFKASLQGEVLCADDPGYDAARSVWNAMIDRRPQLIARCTNADDVVQAVNFARTHEMIVSVRGGGHNVAGKAVCDDGLMIDLTPMKGIQVDPAERHLYAFVVRPEQPQYTFTDGGEQHGGQPEHDV